MSITYVASQFQQITSSTFVTTSAVSVGDLLLVYTYTQGFGSSTPLTFTDNVNSGNYNNFTPLYDATMRQYSLSWIRCNAAGTPTITCTQLGSVFAYWTVVHYTGFVGTASYAGSGASDYTSIGIPGSSNTAVALTSFTTSKNSELVVAFPGDLNGQNWSVVPASPWNHRGNITVGSDVFDQVVSISGTAVQLTGTLAGNDFWYGAQVGFYDASSAAAIAWVT